MSLPRAPPGPACPSSPPGQKKASPLPVYGDHIGSDRVPEPLTQLCKVAIVNPAEKAEAGLGSGALVVGCLPAKPDIGQINFILYFVSFL